MQKLFAERQDMSSFLTLVNKWWIIANAKKRFVPNALGTAGKGKMDFFKRPFSSRMARKMVSERLSKMVL